MDPKEPATAAADAADKTVLVVVATAAMWRAGRAWPEGRTDLTAEQLATIEPAKLERLKTDPNFTVIAGKDAPKALAKAMGVDSDAYATVVATNPMWRAGKLWPTGPSPLTKEEYAELGAERLARLDVDPNFTVVAPKGKEKVSV